jgi:nitrate reductase delta subunit
MKVLKILSLLLHYPDGTVTTHADELQAMILEEPRLNPPTRQALADLIRTQQQRDLLDLQADYVSLFDRGRALSLHLFEHVHGESRDRGQAMAELLNRYRQHGFDISANELPDYLPLFLEFCSRLDDEEALEWLQKIEHILQMLHGRLETRQSSFAVVFKAILECGELATGDESLRHKLQSEQRDDTPLALDEAWAEEPVFFGPAGGCNTLATNKGQQIPIDTSGLHQGRG